MFFCLSGKNENKCPLAGSSSIFYLCCSGIILIYPFSLIKLPMELIHFSAGTSTVEQAMAQLKIARSDIVKSILLFAGDKPVLCILQGDRSIDFQKVRALTNESNVRMATPAEVLANTGFPVGAVTPLSSLPLVFLDSPVAEREKVYAGGGTKETLMLVSVREILSSSHPKVHPISRPK